MAEKKIPVLTEVYTPKKSKKADVAQSEPLQITPELVAQIAAQIKPNSEHQATSALVESLREEVHVLREELAAASRGLAIEATDNSHSNEALDSVRAELAALSEDVTSTKQHFSEKVAAVSTTSETLDTLSEELTRLRGEVAASAQDLSDKVAASSSETATAEMAQTLSAQVKPRLEAEITDFALEELRSEIKKAREEIMASTQTFVDKTKADLKTEMPKMYQNSIELAQVDLTEQFAALQSEAGAKTEAALSSVSDSVDQLEATQKQLVTQHQSELSNTFGGLQAEVEENLKSAINVELAQVQADAMQDHEKQLSAALAGFLQIQGEAAEKTLLQGMQDYQEKLHIDYQEKLTGQMARALETIKQRVEESTEEQIGIMHSQVGTIQQETFAKLRQDFNAEKDLAFAEAEAEIMNALTEKMQVQSHEVNEQFLAKVNGNLPDVQQVLQENIQSILDSAMPSMETKLRDDLTDEIKQLLLKVSFVLPE